MTPMPLLPAPGILSVILFILYPFILAQTAKTSTNVTAPQNLPCRVTIDAHLFSKTVESYRILIAKPKTYIKDYQPS